jgi:hypothetical protein
MLVFISITIAIAGIFVDKPSFLLFAVMIAGGGLLAVIWGQLR